METGTAWIIVEAPPRKLNHRSSTLEICIAHGCSDEIIDLGSAEQLARYNSDPDGWAAAYFGLTREQYYEWVTSEGSALCGHAGCNNKIPGPMQREADEWKQLHRHALCKRHAPPALNRRGGCGPPTSRPRRAKPDRQAWPWRRGGG
jgi:hypothetical protein